MPARCARLRLAASASPLVRHAQTNTGTRTGNESPSLPQSHWCVSRARPVSLPTVMRGAAMTSQLCEVELLCRRAKGDAGLGELGAPTAFDPSHPPAARHQSYTRRLISR